MLCLPHYMPSTVWGHTPHKVLPTIRLLSWDQLISATFTLNPLTLSSTFTTFIPTHPGSSREPTVPCYLSYNSSSNRTESGICRLFIMQFSSDIASSQLEQQLLNQNYLFFFVQVLHWLASMKPSDVAVRLLPMLIHAAITKLMEHGWLQMILFLPKNLNI